MPYYKWRGVQLTGNIKKGYLFARSESHLDEILLKREIALIGFKPKRRWISQKISLTDRMNAFSQLSTLVAAGILLPDALEIVANQLKNPQFREIMLLVSERVSEGETFSSALSRYPSIANPIMIQLIEAGENSGNLAQTLDSLCAHLRETIDFRRRVKSALLLPAITLFFFFAIMLLIFIVIMPRFMDVFASMGRDIPPLTANMIAISDFLQSAQMGLALAVIALSAMLLWRITRKGRFRRALDWVLLHTPFVGPILQERFLAYVLQAASTLVAGGMPLSQALKTVQNSVKNHLFSAQIAALEGQVAAGSSLSDAMARHPEPIFGQEIVAMIEVAEASGNLSMLLNRASQSYYTQVTQKLTWLTMLIQPLIMLILGLLVALLIFAVYGPIFTISSGF